MRLILNIIWLVFSGLWMFLGWMLVGVIWCVTIVGIPFGLAAFRIGLFSLWPFGRKLVKKPGTRPFSLIGNILWVIFSGIWLAIGYAVTGAVLCISVIGIPLGLGNFKMIPAAFAPLGCEVTSI